jgi:hypothetical protein
VCLCCRGERGRGQEWGGGEKNEKLKCVRDGTVRQKERESERERERECVCVCVCVSECV